MQTRSPLREYAYTLTIIAFATAIAAILRTWVDYKTIGYLYLVCVLVISAFFGRGPIFASALLSTLAWNFFFMPPTFTFIIGSPQDMLMCVTYFFVAILGGYLNARIRSLSERAKDVEILKESERLHQTLMNSISHELRTPLTAIVGNASALADHTIDQSAVVTEITQAAGRLNQVVENLLDMSRIESGHLVLNREVFPVSDLVEHSAQRLKHDLGAHEVRIKSAAVELSDLIEGDFKLLDHALGNLLLNAARHSPPKSPIRISIAETGSIVTIRVADDGPGIPAEYRARVFDKFFRVPGSPSGGIGLGLSIVKGISDAHGAAVAAVDTNSGSAFEMRFSKAVLPETLREDLK